MSVTINNIKVEFHLNPPLVTFLQGADMDILNIRNTLRLIEETEEGRLFESAKVNSDKGVIVRADGNYPYGNDTAALDITIRDPFAVAFEAGAIAFVTEFGSLLVSEDRFVDSPGAIVNIYQAKGALVVTSQGDAGTIAAAVWDRILSGATHNIPQSAGKRLRQLGNVVDGSVNDVAATVTSFETNLTESRDDFYNDQIIRFTSGNLEGHVRVILDYDGTDKKITVSEAMVEVPDNGIDFDIVPFHVHPLEQIAEKTWQHPNASNRQTLNSLNPNI